MRRLWVPMSLLFLLLILCSWQHRHSFDRPIHYTISQQGSKYIMRGEVRTKESLERLQRSFAREHRLLETERVRVDPLLLPEGGFDTVEKLVPLLASQCKNMQLHYEHSRITLRGSVEEERHKAEIGKIMAEAGFAASEQISVDKPEPITFRIVQQGRRAYVMEGAFSGTRQKAALKSYFQKSRARLETEQGGIDPELVDRAGMIEKLEAVIPLFVRRVQQGVLSYQDGRLSIEGKVMHKRRIEEIDTLLEKLGVEGRNRVTLNIRAIRGKRAKRKAKKLAEALERERAQKEAVHRAEKAVFKDVAAMIDRSQSAQKIATDNRQVRKNLKTLFETETIEFNTAQTTLTPVGMATVSKIAVILKAYPDVRIEIAGHTDSDGDDTFNMLLSQGRVNNVKRALMQEGIDRNRIKAVGYGETRPLLPNTTRENKQKNRRVEIIVIGE